MAGIPDLLKLLVPKKQPQGVTSTTPTHNPQQKDAVLSAGQANEHLTSLYDDRLGKTSKQLMQDLFKNDPDVSATFGSYLTLADTPLSMLVYDPQNQIDAAATAQLGQLIRALTRPTDYTQGFTLKPNLQMLCQELRTMLMLRGAIGAELVFDKTLVPNRLQLVDMDSILWFEKAPGVYKPNQKYPGKSEGVSLDIPSFFVAFHRRDPTKIYTNSDFISVINTVAARQQVVNDLYRIMQVTGFPRIELTVLEEILMKSAPASLRDDEEAKAKWAGAQLQIVADTFGDLRADQPFAHFDSVAASVINEKAPGSSLQVTEVVNVLNAQNQAALKTMPTVLGRGNGSVQVASAEVRIAAMNADQLNVPLKQLLDQALTFLINSYGIAGFVECRFAPAELRPDLELEPQRVLKQSRLLQDLSLGNITDEEYHLQMFGRLPPASAPPLSGTGFMAQGAATAADGFSPNANGGSLGNSLAPGGKKATDQTKSNSTPKMKNGISLTLNIQ